MLYDKYKKIMARLASVVNFIKRFRVLILTLISVAVACTATGMAVNGLIYDKVDCPTKIEYGQPLTYKANALFEDLYYEYCEKGSSNWSREIPRVAGEYQVRAVSRRVFGAKSYGDVHSFAIQPKEVEVWVQDETIEYGKTPAVTAKLIGEDKITCDKMSYSDLGNKTVSKVTPVKENIRVTDKDGNDVTASYAFVPVEREIAFDVRTIEVTLAGLEVVYNGEPYATDEYEITDGALAFDDTLSFSFDKTLTEVGTEENTATVNVFTEDGVEVTHQYFVVIKCGDLVVNKRPVTLETSSESFVYNGKANTSYSCTVQEAENAYGLVKGHKLVRDEQIDCSIQNVGTKENVLAYSVVDASGKDVTPNYDISYVYGTLTVVNRAVTLVTDSKSFVYNGEDNVSNVCTVKSGAGGSYVLCEGHSLFRDETVNASVVGVGTVKNELAYFIKDEDGNDVTEQYTLTYEYGTLEVTPRTIKIQTATSTHVYDGQTYTDGGFDYAEDSEYKVVEGHELKRTSDLVPVQYVEETPTENKFEITVYEGETDITANYAIEYVYGTIAITPLEITFTVKDDSKVYDGTPLKGSNYEPVPALIGEDLPTVKYTGEITDVGEENCEMSVEKIVSGERDVTACYAITYEKGTLKVTERALKVTTGSHSWQYDGAKHSYTENATGDNLVELQKVVYDTEKGATEISEVVLKDKEVVGVDNQYAVRVISEDGASDYTANYKIEYVYGKLTIQPLPITVKTATSTHVYDGEAYTDATFDYAENTPNRVLNGHDVKAVGELASVVYVETEATSNVFAVGVYEGETDKSHNYAISYEYGTISVTPRAVTFAVVYDKRIYDGKIQKATNYTDEGLFWQDIPNVHFEGEITNVGKIDCEMVIEKIMQGERDVTACYDFKCEKGVLEIIPRPVTVVTKDKAFIYDGTEHSYPHGTAGNLADGHELSVHDDYTTVTELGTVKNIFTVSVLDGETPVTENYIIDYEYGELTVTVRPITIGSRSAVKIYDGTPLVAPEYEICVFGDYVSLLEGHYVSNAPKATGAQTDAGSSTNTFNVDLDSLRVCDKEGNDVTKYYAFVGKIEGELKVTPRPLTVQTATSTWVYDGQVHSNEQETRALNDESTPDDGLVLDHAIWVESYAQLLDVGTCVNTQTVNVWTGDRIDTSRNYEIIYKTGTLTVTKRPVTISTGSYTWVYDGEYHHYIDDTKEVEKDEADYGLLAGHICTPQNNYTEIRDYGEKTNKYTVIITSAGVDVTGNYNIKYVHGTLSIVKRPVFVYTGSYTWVYEGQWKIYTEAEVTKTEQEESGLFIKHDWKVDTSAPISEIRNVGSIKNEYKIRIYRRTGDVDVTDNYEILYQYGTLKITPRPLIMQTSDDEWVYDDTEHHNDTCVADKLVGTDKYVVKEYTTIIDAGEKPNVHDWTIYSGTEEVISNYDVLEVKWGTLRVTPRKINVETESATFVYDGTPHSRPIVSTSLIYGHTPHVNDGYTTLTELGTVDNVLTVSIMKGEIDITRNYEIFYDYGTLTVIPRQVDIIALDLEKIYDDTPLVGAYNIKGDGLLDGHTFATPIENNGRLINVGKQEYTLLLDTKTLVVVDAEGNDVTKYYRFSAQKKATLTVTPRRLFVKTGTAEWIYDGKEHYYIEGTYVVEEKADDYGLVDGHTFTVGSYATITKVGKTPNEQKFVILSADGRNVTRNYVIETKFGELKITPRPITIQTASAEKKYDGKPLTMKDYIVNGLLETDRFDQNVSANGTRTQVGSVDNTLNVDVATLRILNKNGVDVTNQYKPIELVLGTLTIKPSQKGDLLGLNGSLEGQNNKADDEEDQKKELFSFTVEKDGTVYFRIKSYGDYNFNGWKEAPVYEVSDLTVSPLYFVALALQENGYDLSRITINDLHGQMYRMLPYFAQADFDEALSDIMLTQEDWDSYTLSMYTYEYMLGDGITLAGTPYEAMEEAYREFVYKNYLDLPLSTKTAMEDVIAREGLYQDSETLLYDVANLVRGYVPYDLFCPEYEGDYAIYFFEQADTALCRYYATAAIALYRTFGIPARYVEGYMSQGFADMTNTVTANQGHAWVEVYIDGLGWIPMEVTGGSEGPITIGGGGGGAGGGKLIPKITVKPLNIEQRYDPANPTVYALNELDETQLREYLDQGYTYKVEITGRQTGVGYSRTRIVEQTFKFYNKYGTDVTDEFIWIFETGLITIYDDFYVEVYGFEFTYDGTFYHYVDYEQFGVAWYEIHCPEGYEISFDASEIGMRDAGILDMADFYRMPITVKYKGEVLTDNVPKVMFIGEPMRIDKRYIVVVTGSSTAEYTEGLILTDDSAEITKGELCEGDKLVIEINGKQEGVGESQNKFQTLIIENADGENVTDNYEVSYVLGILKVVESA